MTGWKTEIDRRPLLAGLLAVLGIAAVGGGAYELPALFRRRYPAGPYDDLLARLSDRDNASRLGGAVLRGDPGFDAHKEAHALRLKLAQKSLAEVATSDLSENRLIEVEGWVLPGTLATLAALSAKAG